MSKVNQDDAADGEPIASIEIWDMGWNANVNLSDTNVAYSWELDTDLEAARLIDAPAVGIRLMENGVLVASATTSPMEAFIAEGTELEPAYRVVEGMSPIGHVMATKKTIVYDPYTEWDVTRAVCER